MKQLPKARLRSLRRRKRPRPQTFQEKFTLPPRSRKTRPQLECKFDYDCYNGQFCGEDVGKCFDKGHGQYKDACFRDGGSIKKHIFR